MRHVITVVLPLTRCTPVFGWPGTLVRRLAQFCVITASEMTGTQCYTNDNGASETAFSARVCLGS